MKHSHSTSHRSFWTIGRRVAFGFMAVILIAIALGGFAYERLVKIRSHTAEMTRRMLPSMRNVEEANALSRENNMLVYKHIGSLDDADMAQIEATIKANSARATVCYQNYERLIEDPKNRQLFAVTKATRAEYLTLWAEVLVISSEKKNVEAYQMSRSRLDPLFVKFFASVEACREYTRQKADHEAELTLKAVQDAKNGIVIGLVAAVLVAVGIAFAIIRKTNKALSSITQALTVGSRETAAAASQVSSASQSLAEGASEQAASLEETSASLEEISSMTKRNADNANNAKDLSNQTRSAADNGARDMEEMSLAMGEIKIASNNIAKIIKTIDEIAFQTNILALNAAVEAARAGEAGAGFAVVADEVRNLAQRSAQAAKETAAKIEDCIVKSEKGVGISSKVSDSLTLILDKASQVDELVAEIATASNEQTMGLDQVNTAVTQMDSVTQSNAANAEESASAAEELNAQAEALKDSVAELQKLVGAASGLAISQPDPVAPAAAPAEAAAPKKSVIRTNRNGDKALPAQPARMLATNGHHSAFPLDETEF